MDDYAPKKIIDRLTGEPEISESTKRFMEREASFETKSYHAGEEKGYKRGMFGGFAAGVAAAALAGIATAVGIMSKKK